MIVSLRHRQHKHICSLNVRDLLEHGHQFRQIEELGEASFCPITGALRGELNGRDCFPEGRGPAVKVNEIVAAQGIILEIFLHGVHLHHRVRDRCAGRKHHAAPSGQFVQVLAFHIQVAGLLCLCLADAAHIAHLGKGGKVLVIMRLVDEQAVNAELLKGHHIVLAGLIVEFFQLELYLLFAAFQLLDGETVSPVALDFHDTFHDLVHLLLQHLLLPFKRERDLFQLAVSDDDSVIVTGGDAAAEAFPILGLKVFCGGHEDIGAGVELQILRGPLLRQVIRHHDQTLLTEAQALALLCQRHHGKGFARTDHMAQQFISAVQPTGDGVKLMLAQTDFRVDPCQTQMTAVILAGSNRVELLVVQFRQTFPARGVFPDPLLKCLLDQFLLGLRNSGLFLVQYRRPLAVRVLDIVKDAHVLQIKGLLQDLVAVDAVGAVGVERADVASVAGFALDIPFARVGGKMDLDLPAGVVGRPEQFIHEVFVVLRGYPGRAESYGDLRRGQIDRLYLLQGLHIGGIAFRILFGLPPCFPQLLPDVAGEILVRRQVFGLTVPGAGRVAGIDEDDAPEVRDDLCLRAVAQLHHIVHVHPCFFGQ